MLVTHFFICSIFSIVYCQWQIGSQFSREDCYESLTNPKIVLKLLHYSPSGPKFFSANFQSGIYYKNLSIDFYYFDAIYNFKKIDGQCYSSIIFSAKEIEIDFMEIIIRIYFPSSKVNTIYTRLMFKDGFRPGDYVFMDEYSHFGIPAQVIYSKNPFMTKTSHIDISEIYFYFSSLTIDKNDICVITENNRQVALRPYYHGEISKGFIIGIVYIFENIEYQAFECINNEAYRYETVAFIFEKLPKSLRYLNAIYAQWNGIEFIRNEIQFSVFGINLYKVNQSPILSPNLKQVFLIKSKHTSKYKKQRKGEKVNTNLQYLNMYESNDGTIYKAYKLMDMDISPYVTRQFRTYYFTLFLNEL